MHGGLFDNGGEKCQAGTSVLGRGRIDDWHTRRLSIEHWDQQVMRGSAHDEGISLCEQCGHISRPHSPDLHPRRSRCGHTESFFIFS